MVYLHKKRCDDKNERASEVNLIYLYKTRVLSSAKSDDFLEMHRFFTRVKARVKM